VLLDTHAFLWFIDDSPELSADAKAVIADGSDDVVLRMASLSRGVT
jgi:PIN domain nuclease of toxin-antitoxin system